MAVFPITDLPKEGMTLEIKFQTETVTARSGKEQRRALWTAPRHGASLTWDKDVAAAITGPLYAFYVARKGSYESFTYFDFDPLMVWTGANIAMGTTVAGTLAYDLPGKTISSAHIHIDGSTATGTISAGTGADGRDQFVFGSDPGAGHALVAVDFTGQRVFTMRFAEDSLSYSRFAAAVYSTGVNLVEVK